MYVNNIHLHKENILDENATIWRKFYRKIICRKIKGWGEREGVGGEGRNDPNIVCTYE
jgi:hypothetical protein